MPSLWSGTITFGLVSIPVRLETSHRGSDLSFNLLHKECRQRINQKYYCSTCDEYLERSDLVRGYEYEKGRYVVLEEDDFDKAEGEASRNIDVVAFIDYAQLKPFFLNKTYYLVPEKGAEKGYLLLLKGMEETQKVAITRFVMRGKEYIGAVNFSPEGMLLHILFHKGEFKDIDEVVHLPEVELKQKELSLARQIIDNLTEDFSEEMLTDQYRERLLEVIRQKVEGEQVTVAAEKRPPKVVDLMEALKRSLAMTAQKKPVAGVSRRADQQEERKKRKRA
jgi:DNA end-binding protein Ku